MCGCGITKWCDGCPCGCNHGTEEGAKAQGRYFASKLQGVVETVASVNEMLYRQRVMHAELIGAAYPPLIEVDRVLELTSRVH